MYEAEKDDAGCMINGDKTHIRKAAVHVRIEAEKT